VAIVLDPVFLLIPPLVLAFLFGASCASKIRAWEEFVGVAQNYRLLPRPLVRPVAYALPPIEGAVALGLLASPSRRLAAIVAIALLAVFSAAVGVNLARGRRHIDCGCFRGVLRQPLSWWLLGRNGVLITLALICVPDAAAARALTWLDLVTVGGGTVALVLLLVAASSVLGPPPQPAVALGDGVG